MSRSDLRGASAESLSTLAAALPIVVGGAATMFLVTSMFWLARKTHRLVNNSADELIALARRDDDALRSSTTAVTCLPVP